MVKEKDFCYSLSWCMSHVPTVCCWSWLSTTSFLVSFSNTFDGSSLSYGIYISIYLLKICMEFLLLKLGIMFYQNMDNYDSPQLPFSCCSQQYLLIVTPFCLCDTCSFIHFLKLVSFRTWVIKVLHYFLYFVFESINCSFIIALSWYWILYVPFPFGSWTIIALHSFLFLLLCFLHFF